MLAGVAMKPLVQVVAGGPQPGATLRTISWLSRIRSTERMKGGARCHSVEHARGNRSVPRGFDTSMLAHSILAVPSTAKGRAVRPVTLFVS